MDVLGTVIERYGLPLMEIATIHEKIFKPLGMLNTLYSTN